MVNNFIIYNQKSFLKSMSKTTEKIRIKNIL